MRDSRWALVIATLLAAVIGCGAPAPSTAPSTSPGTTPVAEPTASSGSPQTGLPATPGLTTPEPGGPSATMPPLPESADLAPLPPPAPLPEGAPQEQAEALIASLAAATTTAQRLPLVMTVLLASGIPILDGNGDVVPFEPQPSGPALDAWEVHALAATDPTRHVRLTSRDFADLFPGASDPDAFIEAFSLDLRTAAFAVDPQGQRWAYLIAARDPRGALQAMATSEGESLFFDGLQVQLILHRLTVDLWRESLAEPSGNGFALALSRAAATPCHYNETEDKIVTVAEEGGSVAMGKVIEYLDDKGVAGMGALGKAAMVADIASFIVPYLLLTIDFELSAPPLVRTKSTAQDGERRQLAATLRFDSKDLQLVNCFRLMFASAGMTFSVPVDGPLANGSVSWEPNGGFDRVQFYGDPVHAHSDDQGIAIIGVEGRRQKHEVAPAAGRVNADASVLLTYRIKELSIGQDIWDAASGGGSPLNILLEGLARAKWSSAGFTFPVVDWGERWQAEIVIDEKSDTGSIYYSWAGIMGVDSEGLIVGLGAGSASIVTSLCVDVGPDRHSEAIDWRLDGEHTFAFDGYKENDVFHLLLPNLTQVFRRTGDPGPCAFASAFHQASMQTTLITMGDYPIQIRAEPGTQSIPFGETTVTIRLEPLSD